MRCYYHPEIEAVAACVACGKAICQTCSVDVAGRITCQRCLSAGGAGHPQLQPSRPTSPLAIASLMLGIIGLCGGVPFAAAAWITGHLALKQLSENLNEEGAQLANAGKILGMAMTILYSALILCYIMFLVGTFLISLVQQALN